MIIRNTMSLCMIIYCLLILSIYLIKRDRSNPITNKFIYLQLAVLVSLSYNFLAFNIFKYFDLDSNLPIILSRIYISTFIILFYALEVYIFEGIFRVSVSLFTKGKKNLVSYGLAFVSLFGIVGALSFPTVFEWDGMYSFNFYGVASYTVYVICIGFHIFNFIYYLINKSKLNLPFKDFFPVILIPFMFIAASILSLFWSYSFLEMAIVLMISLIYFKYEKPDERLQGVLETSIIDLKKASRFKTDFLSSTSHELKTPLNSIIYIIKSTMDMKYLSSREKMDLEDMLYCSNSLIETIDNLLLMSKLEHKNYVFARSVYNIRNDVNDLPVLTKIHNRKNDINFFLEIENRVPDLLYGERELVYTIINNALDFSNRYIEKGTISLKLGWVYKNNCSSLTVEINNVCSECGNIYSHIDDNMVEIYDSVNNADFGINLACILTKKLNGKIDFDYENGIHNSIFFTLPQVANQEQYNIDEVRFDGKNALVVDDAEINIKVATKQLEALGFEVTACRSGTEALSLCENYKYDYVFLDINMPNMNGEETLSKLKELGDFKSKVIAVTADDGINSSKKYSDEGFNEYIVKPFKKNDLVSKLVKVNDEEAE